MVDNEAWTCSDESCSRWKYSKRKRKEEKTTYPQINPFIPVPAPSAFFPVSTSTTATPCHMQSGPVHGHPCACDVIPMRGQCTHPSPSTAISIAPITNEPRPSDGHNRNTRHWWLRAKG